MPQLNISLPDALKAWTETRVAEGRFSSPSDYVRDLIRRDQDAVAELRWLQGEIDKGLASPVDPRSHSQIIADVIEQGRKVA
ncbi:MAG: type II toxin-antitoxin system ParD family antitoxin [Novosphingobium sp.]